MENDKARRAFQNFILEMVERYENHGGDYCGDICECSFECKCYGACGTEPCVNKLIEFYGGDSFEDN